MERFLHKPTAAAAAAAASRHAARQQDRPSKFADAAHPTNKKKKRHKQKQTSSAKHRKQAARGSVVKRAELWPMDFLHTHLLGEQPVVVTDAVPSSDVQSLLRENSRSRHNHGLADMQLAVPYFVDTDAIVRVTGSNPNLFLQNASAVPLEEGTPHRSVACGSQLLMAVGNQEIAAAPIDVVLRAPPLSAMDCLSRTSVRGGRLADTAFAPEEETVAKASDTAPTTGTKMAEGRWDETSCVHIGKAMW